NGKVSVSALNLGTLLKSGAGMGRLTMNAEVSATAKEVNNFIAKVDLFEYNNYSYRNVTAEGTFKNNIGNASIAVADSNLTADLNGYIDLNKSPFLYDFTGDFKNVNLYRLNFYSSPLTINTHLEMHMQGSDPDSLRGNVFASQLSVENDKSRFIIDTIMAKADYNGIQKLVSIKSKILTGNISGNFRYKDIGPASTHLMSHYFTGMKLPEGQHAVHIDSIRFSFKTGNLNGLTEVFMPSIQKLNGLNMDGYFANSTHKLLIDVKLKEFTFSGTNVNNINVNLIGDKEKMDFSASTNTVFVNNNFKFYSPKVKGILHHDSLDFNVKMNDPASKSNLDLDGILTFNKDTFKLLLPRADMALQNNVWKISELAQIKYGPEYLDIQNLNLTSGAQSILINSDNLRRGTSLLFIEFKAVEIGNLAKLGGLSFDLQGQLNGRSELRNIFTTMGIRSDLTLANLTAERRAIGNLAFTANKPEGNDLLSLNAGLSGVNEASLIGTYNFSPAAENLNFHFKISKLNTNAIEPFIKDILYNLNGQMLADLHISGKTESPMVLGKVVFKGYHTLGMTSLQTVYNLRDQEISFMPTSVQLNKFTILDTLQNAAVIDGAINHEQMKNFNFNLTFNTDNFQFLNSRYNSYVPYYGKFFAKVKVELKGPLEDLNIIADITTLKNTNLSLNLQSDNARQGLPSYISFVSRGVDSTGLQRILLDSTQSDVAIDLSKFNIKSNMTVTQDAIINLVLDPATGDKIVGRGNGNFLFNFDSNNAINLYGTYTIEEGSYTFSFMNVVKKEFTVEKGGTVSWYGDPESGIMNIRAIYEAKASRYDLISDQAGMMSKEQISAAKRPQPVFVYLNMAGEFTKPEITFDIVVPEGSGQLTANAVTQRINQIKNNESELNKQVLGLIVFNKFFPEGGASGNDGSGPDIGSKASESVSGLLSSQLNELSAKYLQGVELNVNVENMNGANGNYNNINLTASKQINERVTVQAGSDITSGKSNSTGLTGDYALLYRVNRGGNLNLKFFRNSQTNIYNSNINYIQGASISHFKSFDSFRFRRRKKDDVSVN
ncbi:MAG TPA: translocation/assembly module TamB domain-containing protein, partial [Cytophagaceae bacterium]